jgi:hypothetical protein
MVDHILFLSPVDFLLSLSLFSRFLSPQPFMKNDKKRTERRSGKTTLLLFLTFFFSAEIPLGFGCFFYVLISVYLLFLIYGFIYRYTYTFQTPLYIL